jgi:hypothetical protein
MVEYSQTARQTAEYRLVGGGTAEFRQPAGGLARGGAGDVMSKHASVLVDSVGPLSAEVCKTAASFP